MSTDTKMYECKEPPKNWDSAKLVLPNYDAQNPKAEAALVYVECFTALTYMCRERTLFIDVRERGSADVDTYAVRVKVDFSAENFRKSI